MKNIIVGIDFSKNSINSLKHAVAIALKTGATLHLVWVKTPSISKGLAKDQEGIMMKNAHKQLDELVASCKVEAPKSEVLSIILEGKPAQQIPTYAKNLPQSIIVIGTHGLSGFEERFIGSNAFKTVCASTVPVLVLREGIQINRDLTDILIPIDTSFETLQKVNPAIAFAQAFSAKIHLLGVFVKSPEDKHIIKVVTGLRSSGKSTLLEIFAQLKLKELSI